MKTAKRLLWFIILLPLVLIGLLIALLFTLDPNRLKPVLHDAAAAQGVEMDIQGDLTWRFWPDLGFGVSAITLKEAGGKEPLFSARDIALSVQLRPLFQREIRVDGISVSAATINLLVDERGRTNWSNIGSGTASREDPAQEEGPPPELSVAEVRITDATLSYRDLQSDQTVLIQDLDLETGRLALDGQPFPLTVAMIARLNELPTLEVKFAGDLGLNLGEQTAVLDQAELRLRSPLEQAGSPVANMRLSTHTHWGDALSSTGQLHLDAVDARAWLTLLSDEPLVTRNPSALTRVGADIPYDFREDQLRLPEFDLQLDQTQIKGTLVVGLGETLAMQGDVRGTQINVDDYLPPPEEPGATTATTPDAATPEPTPLPMDALRSLALELTLAFNQLVVQEIAVQQPQIKITAQEGLWLFEQLTAGVAGGTVTGDGQLDASAETARMKLAMAAESIDLGQILREVADFSDIQGQVQARVNLLSSGQTDLALIDNLVAEATVQSSQMQWQKVNLEQQFCKAMAFLQAGEPPAYNWPGFTEAKSVDLKLAYADQTLQINNLNAMLAKLNARAEGMFNVDTGRFDVPFSLSLGSFAGDMAGCLPIDQKWRDRALPIRCKGKLDEFGPKTCLPDVKLLTDIAKGRVKSQVNEKIQEKKAEIDQKVEQKKDEVEQELKDKTQQLLREKLGDQKGKATEDNVRDIFKKMKQN